MNNRTVSIKTLCNELSIGRTKAYQMIAKGDLESVKIGRRTLVTTRSIDSLVERGATEARRMLGRS